MPLVLDTCCFVNVLKKDAEDCATPFKEVKLWIMDNSLTPKLVGGGTKYELEMKRSCFGFFSELSRINKFKLLDKTKIDQKENELMALNLGSDFDDAHIAAILLVSGSRLVCCADKRAYKFLKHRKVFSTNKPKIINEVTKKAACLKLLREKG